MSSAIAGREKAMAAVRAMFARYKLLAAQRPKDHIVSVLVSIATLPTNAFEDYDRDVMENLKLIDAGLDGSVVYDLYISPNFSNLNNVMHGGAAGVIFDMSTTTALCPVARPGSWEFMGGVTRSLNISYLRAVPIGTHVRLNSKVVSVGKQMAMIRGDMTSMDGKVTFCTVEHHKVNTPVLPEHLQARIPWDDDFEKEWGVKTEGGTRSKI